MGDDRDWRKSGYLLKKNWPECIPWYGPKREYGPYSWQLGYGTPEGDLYPHSHPDAASIGDLYLGDVCPCCGVPLSRAEEVMLLDGTMGMFDEISALNEPESAYHPECWRERDGTERVELTAFSGDAADE